MALDNTAKINEIREALESGVTSSRKDDHSAEQDLSQLRKELRRLILQDRASIDAGRGRHLVNSFSDMLRGAW